MILTDNNLSKEITQYVNIDEATEIIKQLEWELKNSPISGIGLAAPQIGINKAVAIVRIVNPKLDKTNPIISINLVNPLIIEAHDLIEYNEGCLSFPGKQAKVLRYNEIVLETLDDYDFYSEKICSKRLNQNSKDESPMLKNLRRKIHLGEEEPGDIIGRLICVCVQHELSHLLGLTMFDFYPHSIGRNEQCPCGSNKKNKKCHNYNIYNQNIKKLFDISYHS